ncbi:hypothetical protein DFH09DRAFT_1362442 [Mycena vulgaris]|nr:hypothetical protein DFH09DRAFT_1362442 [Mycena vulgaris]
MATSSALSNTGAPESISGSAPAPPLTAAKRTFQDIVATQMAPVPVLANKRAKRNTIETKTPLEKLMSSAKFFVRGVNPYMDISLAMFYGSEALWASRAAPDPSNAMIIPPEELAQQKRYVDAFNMMMAIAPSSLDVLHEFYMDDTQWNRLVRMFRQAAASARQNDTGALKQKIKYLPSDPTQLIIPALSDSPSKTDRGLNHPMLRDAMISWPLRTQINARIASAAAEDTSEASLTPHALESLKALMKGKRVDKDKPAVTANQYPSCFYQDGAYDPVDTEKGLFRGLFLVLRHIWTGPSSAMGGADTLKRSCNARAHGQYRVTGRMVGYGCSQARTMISSADWSIKDGSYDYEKLFTSVVALFETDPADPWVVETLAWLQQAVFGSAQATDASGSIDSDDEESAAASILARHVVRLGCSVPLGAAGASALDIMTHPDHIAQFERNLALRAGFIRMLVLDRGFPWSYTTPFVVPRNIARWRRDAGWLKHLRWAVTRQAAPLVHKSAAAAASLSISAPPPLKFIHHPFPSPVYTSAMTSSASSSSNNSPPSIFDHPRSAPQPRVPPTSSASSQSTPEGFILPLIPPTPDPLTIALDARGHRVLPNVSNTPLPVTDGRVTKLVQDHSLLVPKCANCLEMAVPCSFTEMGIPCPPCAVLGVPECDWSDPFFFMENLRRCRDLYLRDECNELLDSVKSNTLPTSLFEHEFARSQQWFYDGAQGAITRFLLNSYATRDVALHGYQALAASSSSIPTLLRFIALGVETRVHPSILQVVGERVQDLLTAMIPS